MYLIEKEYLNVALCFHIYNLIYVSLQTIESSPTGENEDGEDVRLSQLVSLLLQIISFDK